MPEVASRPMVNGPTSSRKFRRTGGASSDVEIRSRQSTEASVAFRSGAQLLLTLAHTHESAEHVPRDALRVPNAVLQVPGDAQLVLYAVFQVPRDVFLVP